MIASVHALTELLSLYSYSYLSVNRILSVSLDPRRPCETLWRGMSPLRSEGSLTAPPGRVLVVQLGSGRSMRIPHVPNGIAESRRRDSRCRCHVRLFASRLSPGNPSTSSRGCRWMHGM